MATVSGILDGQGKRKVCPKCGCTELETYLASGGVQQLCPNCNWTSEDKFDFEMVVGNATPSVPIKP